MAEIVKKSGSVGNLVAGISFQILAIFSLLSCVIIGPLGVLVFLVFFITGSILAWVGNFRCSDCGNQVPDKDVKICPVCHVKF